tara:strand:- start:542 stop:1729 length:1188 start_codon:yes stop_codon:yes gene_type:complete
MSEGALMENENSVMESNDLINELMTFAQQNNVIEKLNSLDPNTMGNGDTSLGGALDNILNNESLKDMVSDFSKKLGVDSDEVKNTLSDPNFSNEIKEQLSNFNISKIADVAGDLLKISPDTTGAIKNSLAAAQDKLSDLVSKPKDVEITLDINKSESYKGSRKKITVKRLKYESSKNAFVQEKQKLVINVPPGTRNLKKFIIESEGDEYVNSKNELNRSNLIVTIKVEEDPNFLNVGNDLYYTLPVTLNDFLEDKYYKIKFIDMEEITLFKPREFKLSNRIIGKVEGLGMPPNPESEPLEEEKEIGGTPLETSNDSKDVNFGDLIIMFSIKFKGRSSLETSVKSLTSQDSLASNAETSTELGSIETSKKEKSVENEEPKNNYYTIVEHLPKEKIL